MKALQLVAPSRFDLVDLPVPDPGAGELLVKVKACGICGSDIHGMDGSSGRRIPPIVMGHEASGIVHKTGADVADWSPGDRLTFDSTIYCGECGYCRRGRVNLCENREVLGVSCGEFRRQGAFAEYVVVPARICHRLPGDLPFEEAAFAEPVGVALHAVHRLRLGPGESALVVGAGLIGLLVVQALRRAGCERIIAVDLADDRLALARKLGATDVINSVSGDAAAAVRDLTDGDGAHVALEVVGTTPTVQLAMDAVRKGGRVCLVGNITPTVEFPLQVAVARELDILGSCAINGEYPDALAAIADRTIDVRPLISATAPLDDGAEWFARLHAGDPGTFKVILQP
ncbi:MAG: galactitol-1-phosphate 5-dehydrogenase [Akkermansiaceae bacterium]|nr:galactitol-1-phosphate 5-dehydrogenase [Akkermansiaceae bacterium]NNM28308.1 galactitol-1-phosphate 5-dehydrogenase [Akkermansiaceae bacterium]